MNPEQEKPTRPTRRETTPILPLTWRQFPHGSEDYAQALDLRESVLRAPLGLVLTPEEMAGEPDFFHLGGFAGGRLLAVLLLCPLDPRTVKMRQVAVHPAFQNRGLGAQLVAFAERFASERGFGKVVAHARESASGFYRQAGYTLDSRIFLETTIPHRLVTKELSAATKCGGSADGRA